MSQCRTGCPTQSHSNYAECLRDANVRPVYVRDGNSLTKEKRWDRELAAYRDARKEGIQPEAPTFRAIDKARRISDEQGSAYVGGGA